MRKAQAKVKVLQFPPVRAEELKRLLEKGGFAFREVPHALFGASKPGVSVTLYGSGKLLIQGKEAESFTETVLRAEKGLWKEDHPAGGDWIGSDESGKGDYFGPLVVAAVFADRALRKTLTLLGVMDSKKIADGRAVSLATEIVGACPNSVVTLPPKRYNELYGEFRNLNSLLAWAHARALENLLGEVPCRRALVDRFANEAVLSRALMARGRQIQIEQRVRAEEDVAVAAASLVARAEYLKWRERLQEEFGLPLPKGAGKEVEAAATRFIERHGFPALGRVAKLHFRITDRVAPPLFRSGKNGVSNA
jgi:ribonuclease HIII